ncbi:MAG: DUF2017 family protein [Actinomycetaceae bacterium]|nr:DUF2017 family protein [Actinomycetaceae bacterium]
MLISGFERCEFGYVAQLDEELSEVLQRLLGETITVLDAPDEATVLSSIVGEEQYREEPDDPTLQTLLPPMSDDPLEAESLRALTEDSLRTEKSARLQMILTALREHMTGERKAVLVEDGEEWQWLSGLNDLRLVLAQRLGVGTPGWEVLEARVVKLLDTSSELIVTVDEVIAIIYLVVSWWQDSLLRAVDLSEGASSL